MRTFLQQSLDNDPISGVPAGTVAIYDSGTSGTDHTPASDPFNNLSKIGFHSAFDYIGIISEHSHTITLPATSAGSALTAGDITLFAHGQGAKPLLLMQYSTDNVNWFSVNGTVHTTVSAGFLNRSFHAQADATYVYIRWSSIGNRNPLTVYIRTQILGRTYQASKPSTGVMFDGTGSRLKLSNGILDTQNKYVQSPAGGQTVQAPHTSGQTLGFFDGDEQGEISYSVATSALYGTVSNTPQNVSLDGQSIIYNPAGPLLSRTINSLVFQGPSTVTPGLEINSSRIRLARSDGVVTLDTSRPILALLDEYQGSFSIGATSPTSWSTAVPSTSVLASKAINSGATMIFGWLQLTSYSAGYIATSRPIEFSGAINLWMNAHSWSGAGEYSQLWSHQGLLIYPRISGGALQVVSNVYNQATTSTSSNTPSVSGNFHLFAAALVGGF